MVALVLAIVLPAVPAAVQEAARGAEAALAAREAAFAVRVDDRRARDDVRELVALGPRMGGTGSGARAAEWVGRRFADLGLAVRTLEGPEQWCHEEDAWSVAATVDGEESLLPLATPWGFSPASRGNAPLTLAPAEGAALLAADGRRPRRGPTPAVVLADGVNNLDGRFPVCRPHPRRHRAEVPVFGIPAAEGARLRAALERDAEVRVAWSLEARRFRARPRTVVATLAARDGAPPGHLLFCAHGDSDSGGPGANDNASGVAILLQIASAWTEAIRSGALPPPPREVRFAVWGTEIASTAHYRDTEDTDASPTLAVVNYDQAGFGSGGERLHVEPDDVPANEGLVRVLAGVLADHAGRPGFPARWATNRSLGGTDSYVFSNTKRFEESGRPSVTLFTSAWGSPDEHPRTPGMPGESWRDRERVAIDHDVHYHSIGDTPANTTDREPHNMGWCARVGLLGALRWLDRLDSAGGGSARERDDEGDDERDGQ